MRQEREENQVSQPALLGSPVSSRIEPLSVFLVMRNGFLDFLLVFLSFLGFLGSELFWLAG